MEQVHIERWNVIKQRLRDRDAKGLFDIREFANPTDCGTVCCVMGEAYLLMKEYGLHNAGANKETSIFLGITQRQFNCFLLGNFYKNPLSDITVNEAIAEIDRIIAENCSSERIAIASKKVAQ